MDGFSLSLSVSLVKEWGEALSKQALLPGDHADDAICPL